MWYSYPAQPHPTTATNILTRYQWKARSVNLQREEKIGGGSWRWSNTPVKIYSLVFFTWRSNGHNKGGKCDPLLTENYSHLAKVFMKWGFSSTEIPVALGGRCCSIGVCVVGGSTFSLGVFSSSFKSIDMVN